MNWAASISWSTTPVVAGLAAQGRRKRCTSAAVDASSASVLPPPSATSISPSPSAASRIFSKLPYVDKAKVTRALPNRVTITIQESSAMAYVKADDGYWVVDQNCKLLKSVTDSELTGLARIDQVTEQVFGA